MPGRRPSRRPGRGTCAPNRPPRARTTARVRVPDHEREQGCRCGVSGQRDDAGRPSTRMASVAIQPHERSTQRVRLLGGDPPLPRASPRRGHAFGARRLSPEEDRVVGHLVKFGEHMARDQHGTALVGELPHQLAEGDARRRIQARCRLVEQQHPRIVHQRPGEAQPLLLPAGQHARRRSASSRGRRARSARRPGARPSADRIRKACRSVRASPAWSATPTTPARRASSR